MDLPLERATREREIKMAHQQPPGFGYLDFEPNHELYSLQAGMEMLGLPSKAAGSSSTGSGRYHNDGLMVAPEAAASNPWQQQQPSRLIVDEYSSLRCLLPSDGGAGQPSQGLSLSLWNPDHHLQKPASIHHQQVQYQDARYVQAAQQAAGLRSSKYLVPAQELLREFCDLKESGGPDRTVKKGNNQWEDAASSSSSSALYSMDLLELQKRKAKLLSMLEEVDRRYKRYSEQMRAVVSSFEAIAGEGSATVYSTLASKAMSRHFRCLRDGIVGQVQATKKAMGEKEPAMPGSTRGETPRLRLLDQCIRQQKAFHQAGVMESHPWRPQRGLPERSVSVLRAWLFEHFLHPYPSDVDKHILARQTGLSRSQVSNWFINARVRLWKPMVEEMYLEETKDPDNQSSDAAADHEDDNSNMSSNWPSQNPNPSPNSYLALQRAEDQKPLLIDSDSLSSIVSTSRDPRGSSRISFQQHDPVPRSDNFGVVDHLDFSSYNDCGSSGGGRSFGNGVSLTLGLNQHNEGGMNLSFSQPNQHSLYFSREHVEDCQPVQFSILDGDQAQNLPYRNLMGVQLLHDLAG